MDRVLQIYSVEDKLHSACRALQAGLVIAHATETVYGLAVDPSQAQAVERLVRMKGRAQSKGLVLLLPDRQAVHQLAQQVSALACDLMDMFWPGPLTILFPARREVPESVRGGGDWVAVRLSSSPLVEQLMQVWNKPLVSSSANRSGEPPHVTPLAIEQLWGSEVACILPGTVASNALPSTIIKVDGAQWQIVREGAVPYAKIVAALSDAGRHGCQRVAHF
jgi:L-threonylcarbamoyladenylate synthase